MGEGPQDVDGLSLGDVGRRYPWVASLGARLRIPSILPDSRFDGTRRIRIDGGERQERSHAELVD